MNRPQGNWNAAGWLVVVVFALIGQFYMSPTQPMAESDRIWGIPRDALLFYGVAAALFIALVTISEHPSGLALSEGAAPDVSRLAGRLRGWLARLRVWLAARPVRAALVVAAGGVAYTNLRLLENRGGGSFWDTVGLWVASGLLYLAAFLDWPQASPAAWPAALRAWLAAQRERARANRAELLTLLIIVLVAIGLRFILLGAVPDVVSGDEGRIGTLGRGTLIGEIVNPFITTYGHSTMYLFLEGGMIWLTGLFFGQTSAVALRALHAVLGVLTVPVVYLIGRDLFDRRVGLLAAALLTVSHFHIHFSRIIVAAGIVDALLTGIAVWLFWRGLRSGRVLYFVLSGLTVGAHLYFYMGGRLTFLFLAAYVLALYVLKPKEARPLTGHFVAFAVAFVLVGLPMIYWATAMPQEFMARYNQVGIYGSGWLAQEVARTGKSQFAVLGEQLRDALLAFNYYPANAFYFARLPMLDYWTSIPFVLGLVYALWRTLEERFLLLNAWFWSAIVGGQVLVLSPAQAAYRTIVLVPVVFLLAAFVLIKLIDLARQALTTDRRVLGALLGVFLIVTSVINVRYYFFEWAPGCAYEDVNTRLASHWAKYLATLGRERYDAYLLGGLRLMYGIHPSWDFLTGGMTIVNVNDPVTGPLGTVDPARGAVFLFLPERLSEGDVIERAYPNGTWLQFQECGQVLGYAYQTPLPGSAP